MSEQLKVLMDYTRFHIGVYLSLFAAIVALVRTQDVNPFWLLLTIILFNIVGAAGGIIASHIPNYSDFNDFKATKIGP